MAGRPAAVFAAALETAVRACMAPPGGGKLFFADLTKFPAVFSLSCPKRGPLQRPSDFQQFLGSPVLVKLYRAREGRKEFAGYLGEG